MFRKSIIDLLFVATQSSGTCCGGYRSLYLIRSINGVGLGLENIGTIHSGADDDIELAKRFQIDGDQILIDLDISDLKHHYARVSFEGGAQILSKKIDPKYMNRFYCDWLWEMLGTFLDQKSDKSIIDHLNSDRLKWQFYAKLQNTNPAYREKELLMVANKAYKLQKMPNRQLFYKNVCQMDFKF